MLNDKHARKVAEIEAVVGDLTKAPEKKAAEATSTETKISFEDVNRLLKMIDDANLSPVLQSIITSPDLAAAFGEIETLLGNILR